MNLIDPKLDLPAEIRGSFAPISTKLTRLQVSELLPKVACIADRLVPRKKLLNSDTAKFYPHNSRSKEKC